MIIKRVLLLALALLPLLAPSGARAGNGGGPRLAPDLSRYEGRTIESVTLEVEDATVDEAALGELRARLRVAAGAAFSAVLVRESLQALFDTGRVADARVEARDAAGGGADGRPRVALRFLFRPQVSVAGVEFQIADVPRAGVGEDELRSRVTLLEPGKRLTEAALRENAEAIVAYLHDRGFYRAEVSYDRRLDPTRTRATVVFDVRPGAPTTLESFQIDVKGFDAAALAAVRRELKLQPGEQFTQAALGEDVSRVRRAVIEAGHLAPRLDEPDIRLDSAANRITVTLKGSVGPRVKVEVTGYELKEKRRRELLPIEREGTIDYSAIEEGRRRIRNRLQGEGYFFADVTAVCSVTPPLAPQPDALGVEADPCELLNPDELANSNVSITYEVERGRRFKLTDIRIEGTDRLAVADVDADLRSQTANVFAIVPLLGYGRGYTSEDALERDRRLVEARLRDMGYRRAAVSVRQGVTLESDNLIITFAVTEGPLTRVAGVETRGNQIYTAEQLRGARCEAGTASRDGVPAGAPPEEGCLIVGGPYSRTAARADGERMRSHYVRHGYIEAAVDVSLDELPAAAGGDEQVRLVYQISESDKFFINQIYVNGVVRTRKEAVLEAIPLREGEVLRGDDLAESERVLLNTAEAFRQVLIRTEPAPDGPGGFKRRDVIIDVQERKSLTTEYIVGFSTDTGALGGFEVRNTNLFGKLRQGAIRTRFSKQQQLARVEYFDPRFRRYGVKEFAPLALSVQYQRDTSVTRFFRTTIDRGTNGIVQRFDEEGELVDEFGRRTAGPSINRFSVNLETQRDLELELTAAGAQRKRTTLFLRYNYEDVRLFNIESLLIANMLRPDQGVRLSRFGASLARDTRDRQFDPTRGDFLTVDYALAARALGGNLSFSKLNVRYQRYHAIGRLRDTVLAASVQLGLASLFQTRDRNGNGAVDDADRRLPISERFFAGGATSLRGFSFEEAGPRAVAPFCTFGPQPGPVTNTHPPPEFLQPCGTFRDREGVPVAVNPFTVPIGGNAVAVINLEARVALTRNIQAVPFYDGGNVFDRVGDLFRPGRCEAGRDPNSCQRWTHTVGLGLRLKTPLGSIGADWAYLLNPPEFVVPQFGGATAIHRLKNNQIHFRFGQTF
ncbi:MAG: BamA/TamA family outer membrane protein [Acidobacteria bacterium]|nr:BamA/TamA family outer membrane protein [Acidobacteriota bacterium]